MPEYKKDAVLGMNVHKFLESLHIETPTLPRTPIDQHAIVAQSVKQIMSALRLDRLDDSLAETPDRVAKMYCEEIFYGLDYENFPKCTTVENKMGYDEVIACRATVRSCCEHHLQPFIGVAHVAYIPKQRVLGLSKINRICDYFSRRPQIQERLTEQVHAALRFILDTNDVAVVMEATHFCVLLRGVQDSQSRTTTSKLGGRFRTVPALRQEFFALTQSNPKG